MARMNQLRQSRLAAAVVMHDDQVLLVRRSLTERFLPGVWGIPCGKLNPGEDPAIGALRELKEETGLIGRVRRRAGQSDFISEWDGSTVHNTQVNYLVKPLSFDVTLPEPDQEFRWLPIAELDGAGLDEHNLSAIKQAL
jgi:8-oxo-dGTP diphosphatase